MVRAITFGPVIAARFAECDPERMKHRMVVVGMGVLVLASCRHARLGSEFVEYKGDAAHAEGPEGDTAEDGAGRDP